MQSILILSIIAIILKVISNLPQLYKSYTEKNTSSISYYTLFINIVSSIIIMIIMVLYNKYVLALIPLFYAITVGGLIYFKVLFDGYILFKGSSYSPSEIARLTNNEVDNTILNNDNVEYNKLKKTEDDYIQKIKLESEDKIEPTKVDLNSNTFLDNIGETNYTSSMDKQMEMS